MQLRPPSNLPNLSQQPIGVFDSGVGGLSILQALRAELPHEDFVYVADNGFSPYGERETCFVVERSRAIAAYLMGLEHRPLKALVIACNTATAAAIHLLRQDAPLLPIIGVEPALKPAVSLSQTKHIGVMATRSTLKSAKFKALLDTLAGQASFVCQPCDGLADAIERDDTTKTIALCEAYTRAIGQFGIKNTDIDTLVLGCTHYPFASQHLQALLPKGIQLISNGEPVARQTRRVLSNNELASAQHMGQIQLVSTGDCDLLRQAAKRWLGMDCTVQALKV